MRRSHRPALLIFTEQSFLDKSVKDFMSSFSIRDSAVSFI